MVKWWWHSGKVMADGWLCDVMWWTGGEKELLPYNQLWSPYWSSRNGKGCSSRDSWQTGDLTSSIRCLRRTHPLPGVVVFSLPWGWHNGACVIKSTVPPFPFPTFPGQFLGILMKEPKTTNKLKKSTKLSSWALLMLVWMCCRQQQSTANYNKRTKQLNDKILLIFLELFSLPPAFHPYILL